MAAKTVHVFPSNGSWLVKREGESGKVYVTRREAVAAARKSIKEDSPGQFVVHGKAGEIKECGTYRMTPIQNPHKKSGRAREISRAVGKLALTRVQSGTLRERTSER